MNDTLKEFVKVFSFILVGLILIMGIGALFSGLLTIIYNIFGPVAVTILFFLIFIGLLSWLVVMSDKR